MKLKLSDKLELSFSFGDLVNDLDVEQKHELAKALACDEEIIAAVVELLVDGCTSSIWQVSSETLERERLRVLEKLDTIAYEAIRNVIFERETAQVNERIQSNWSQDVWRTWPKEYRDKCPKIPDRVLGDFWERERVLQELARAKWEVDTHSNQGG